MTPKPRGPRTPMARPAMGPPDHLRAAAENLRAHPDIAADPRFVELVALYLDSHAVHWDLRPVEEWALFSSSPSAELAQHIGELAAAERAHGELVRTP